MEILTAADVEGAIDIATRLKREGRYDWFRGQLEPWPPYSTLLRRQLKDPDGWEQDTKPEIERYLSWLRATPGLERLARDREAALCVAQHYGLPTHYIDFTTEPAVAGFFAVDKCPPGATARHCIYCLNTTDLAKVWKSTRQMHHDRANASQLPALRFVEREVPDLWRLETQRGVFLYCPTTWDEIFQMDRIEFSESSSPAYPTRGDVYPDRKSQLEIFLDDFFAKEQTLNSLRRVVPQIVGAGWKVDEWVTPSVGYYGGIARGGHIGQDPSWTNLQTWFVLPQERAGEVRRLVVPLAVDLATTAKAVSDRFTRGVLRALEFDHELRRNSVTWELQPRQFAPSQPQTLAFARGLDNVWDGLRSLPYEDSDLAAALGNWAGLFRMGVLADPPQAKKVFEELFGQAVEVAFGATDGSGGRGFVSASDLLAAARSDLPDLLADEYQSRSDDIRFLLLNVFSPARLFDFGRFLALFARQLVPSQMLRSAPHFFNPARLRTFGIP